MLKPSRSKLSGRRVPAWAWPVGAVVTGSCVMLGCGETAQQASQSKDAPALTASAGQTGAPAGPTGARVGTPAASSSATPTSLTGAAIATPRPAADEAPPVAQAKPATLTKPVASVKAAPTPKTASGNPGKAGSTAAASPFGQGPMATPPAGARWTICCYIVDGLNHVADSTRMRQSLVNKTARNDWYVIHGQEQSTIYFGFYRSIPSDVGADAAEVGRAKADLTAVKSIRDKQGNKPFEQQSMFVALDAPDPEAPPEWNLFNVDRDRDPADPKRAFWSLQVAAFHANPKRKEAAVEAVQELRAKGVQAFYFHGDQVSSVTVGLWPASAVKAQNRTDVNPDVASGDPNASIVVSNLPVSDKLLPKRVDEKKSVVVAPKLEVLDPSMLKMMKEYPYHSVNYEVGVTRTRQGEKIYESSFLVEIPREKGNGLFDGVDESQRTRVIESGPQNPAMLPTAARSPAILPSNQR